MRGSDPSAAERQRGHGPAGQPQRLDKMCCADDVGNRIPSADLVELDVVDRDAVDLRLGVAERPEDRDGTVAHRRVQG